MIANFLACAFVAIVAVFALVCIGLVIDLFRRG